MVIGSVVFAANSLSAACQFDHLHVDRFNTDQLTSAHLNDISPRKYRAPRSLNQVSSRALRKDLGKRRACDWLRVNQEEGDEGQLQGDVYYR
jgi:hypothetical protein